MPQFLGYIHHDTAKAILFQDHFWHAPEWLPKSHVIVKRDYDTIEVSVVTMAWITRQTGLREFMERKNADKRD